MENKKGVNPFLSFIYSNFNYLSYFPTPHNADLHPHNPQGHSIAWLFSLIRLNGRFDRDNTPPDNNTFWCWSSTVGNENPKKIRKYTKENSQKNKDKILGKLYTHIGTNAVI